MAGLYETLRASPAAITELQTPRIHRVEHGNATIALDSPDEVSLVLNLSEAHRATRWANRRRTVASPQVGAVTVVPPGSPAKFQLEGVASVLTLRLSWAELSTGDAEGHSPNPCGVELLPRLAFPDPVLARWFYGAAGGVEDEQEALGAIVERLLRTHMSRPVRRSHARSGGLPAARLQRVKDLVEADLGQPLALADLAAAAGMSVFHFAREFRRETGLPPHRYVLQRRLGRAVALLSDPTLPVADIAAAAGFSHASHLARHLRRAAGLAPDAFRQGILLRRRPSR